MLVCWSVRTGEHDTPLPLFCLVSGASLQCHVCERENSFECENPTNCAQGDVFCSIVAVSEYVTILGLPRRAAVTSCRH